MRITLIADADHAGGTRTYLEMLVNLFVAHGVELTVLAALPGDDKVFAGFMEKLHISWRRLPQRCRMAQKPFWRQLWELAHLIPLLFTSRPDLIFVSTGSPGFWLSVFLLPFPAVLMLHTAVTAPMGLKERLAAWLPLFRRSPKRRLATVSQFAVDQLVRHWQVTGCFIHNATPFPETARRQQAHEGKTILTAGHVVEYKNPSVWLNVAQRVLVKHPNALFIWCGDGPLLETMRRQACGITGVAFVGRQDSMTEIYAKAAMYFQPSILESHGVAVLEAMSHGLPCIVSNRGGLAESVVHGVTGFVEDADDAEAMATRICLLLEDNDMAACFGERGRQHILKRFMPEKWGSETMEMIKACRDGH